MTRSLQAEYFVLANDMAIPGRWYLGAPYVEGVELDPRDFIQGGCVTVGGAITIRQRQAGKALAFTLADFDLPVVSRQLAETLEAAARNEVQRIPVSVAGDRGEYDILNATALIDALDHARSTVVPWEAGGIRPDLVGKPKLVLDLHVDRARAAGHHFFRLKDWNVPLIVSSPVAQKLVGELGVQLQPA